MNLIASLSLIFLVASIIINIILGFFVYRENSSSATNKIFAWLCGLMSIWLITMYMAPSSDFLPLSLWLTRLTLFFATPMDTTFFLLALTIPAEVTSIKRRALEILFAFSLLVMLISISPYTFTGISITNGSPHPLPGFGLPFAGGFNCFLVIAAVYILSKKYRRAEGVEKEQFRSVMNGIICMFGLVIGTVFFPVLLFKSDLFVPLTPIYTLLFLSLTAYAIVKHHLFNLKVIATQALVTALAIALFAQIIGEQGASQKLISGIILAAVILLGLFLIKSVKKEVAQREQLEILDKELEAANEQLKLLDKARAEFITIASHQLRTPPATIKWYLSALIDGDYGKFRKDQKEIIEKTNRTNNSLIRLIDDMLNVSRIERGKMEFLFEPADLLDLVNITFEQLEPIAGEKHLKLIFKAPKKKPPTIMADKEKIRQVMNNMIDNALKYTKQGTVTINLESTPEEIKFSVTDTGKGFGPEEQGTIFEKYSRGKESIKQSAGLGLGLYVAKVIVEQHKGKIWAESPGAGLGSTFMFSVPVHSGLEKTTLVDLSQNQK